MRVDLDKIGPVRRWPALRTLRESDLAEWGATSTGERLHLAIGILFTPESEPVVVCGDSWCTGTCGFPAGVIRVGDHERKMYSSMTAMGPVMQSWRVKWQGGRFEIPAEYHADLLERWWM